MADMAHVSGLVAANAVNDPFEHCDVVTTTTHKSLRGPRSGMIFYRKGVKTMDKSGSEVFYNFENPINEAVFPGLQGGPHMNQIAAIAVALKQAQSAAFKQYISQVIENAKAFGEAMLGYGYQLVTGGTDTHLLLVNFKPQNLTGSKVEYVLEMMAITANKNTCPGDKSALSPSGIRLGTPALTTRGFTQKDFHTVADFLHQGVTLAKEAQAKSPSVSLKDFKATCNSSLFRSRLEELRNRVETFSAGFMMPGK